MSHHPARSHPLLVAVAGTAALLLVAGCSAAGEAAQAESDTRLAAKAAPAELGGAATASARIAAGGLELSLPAGLTLNFEDSPIKNPAATAILEDAAAMFAAMYQAIGRSDPDDSLYQRYVTGAARTEVAGVISMFSDSDWTVSGQAWVFNRTARLTGPDTGRVGWCADVREVYPQELQSGEVLRSTAGANGVIAYSGSVRRNSAGVWVLTSLTSKRAAASCL
ncbi:MAG TPA: hypothetical protein VKE25_12380 [Actinomycetes bacterium]|nr:hypothetical protein [Actinomycetes bacterium]